MLKQGKKNKIKKKKGGPVGIELAGEISDVYNDKKITMVHGHDKLLVGLPDHFRDEALKRLSTFKNIEILLNDRLDFNAITNNEQNKNEEQKEKENANNTANTGNYIAGHCFFVVCVSLLFHFCVCVFVCVKKKKKPK